MNYVPKRLINEIKPTSTDEFKNVANLTDEEKSYENVENLENDEYQENDENQENVHIDAEKKINTSIDHKSEQRFFKDEVIVVDSSPETSFVTTQNTECFKSALESNETTFHTAKSDPNNLSIVSIDSDSDSAIDSSMEKSQNEKPIQSTVKDVSSGAESFELNASAPNDVSSDKYGGGMPNFNDTLERMEYMMEQGRKMMLNENNTKHTPVQNVKLQNVQKKTPVSQTKSKVLTPGSSSAKKIGVGTRNLTPNKVDLFKRPDQRNVRSPFGAKSASASKAHAAPSQSRIPMKTSSLHKPQFRHIASPIAAYIKNTPEIPLIKTIRPARNLHVEDFNKVCPSTSSLDESTQSVESLPVKSALPRKMYISAPQRKVNIATHFY